MKKKTHEEFLEEFNNKNIHDIEIIGKYNRYHDKIKCKCKNNHIFFMSPAHLLRGQGCPYCSHNKFYKGESFGDKHADLLKYFVNQSDAFSYSEFSGKIVKLKCPTCGEEREMSLATFSKVKNFDCRCCDGISTPNKFIRNIVLLKKDLFDFYKFEYYPRWDNKNYRYDVYFIYQNKKYILELQGKQHYSQLWNGKFNNQKQIDKDKKDLALKNGIDIYLQIPACKSELEYLKNEFIKSGLNEFFELTDKDFINIWKDCQNSYFLKFIEQYNNSNKSVKEISLELGIDRTTGFNYLKKAIECNLSSRKVSKNCKSIRILDLFNNTVYYFNSIKEGYIFLKNEKAINIIYCSFSKKLKKEINIKYNNYMIELL